MGKDDLDAAVQKIEHEAANRERESALRKSQIAREYERKVRMNECHLDRLEDAAEDFVPQAADARLLPRETTITRVTIAKTVWGRRRERGLRYLSHIGLSRELTAIVGVSATT
jgi:hypothetical protein